MALSPEWGYVLKSQPCKVLWLGFESNTLALQQAGWELAVEQHFEEMRIRLLMRHQQLNMYAISEFNTFDFFHYARSQNTPTPVFRVIQAAPRIEVVNMIGDSLDRFRQIDARPAFDRFERKSIEDFGIFNVPLVRTEEIIVDPGEVSDILQKLLEMQSPEQKAIRDRNRGRDRRGEMLEAGPVQKFHAQIISLDSVRAAA